MPSPLAALSPLDGRYARTADPLRDHFSEQALIRYRLRVELAWLQALAAEPGIKELKPFSPSTRKAFSRLVEEFSERDAGMADRTSRMVVGQRCRDFARGEQVWTTQRAESWVFQVDPGYGQAPGQFRLAHVLNAY